LFDHAFKGFQQQGDLKRFGRLGTTFEARELFAFLSTPTPALAKLQRGV